MMTGQNLLYSTKRAKGKPLFLGMIDRFPLLILAGFIVVAYLPYFWNSYTGDNISFISNTRDFLIQLLAQNRYGITAILYFLFGNQVTVFDTWVIGFVNVGLLIGLSWTFYFLVRQTWNSARDRKWIAVISSLLLVINPATYGMFFFRVQSIAIMIAMFLVLLTAWLWIGTSSWVVLRTVLSACLLSIVILTYQTVILFAAALALFLLLSNVKHKLQLLIVSVISGLSAFLVYFLGSQMLTQLVSYLFKDNYDAGREFLAYMKWSHFSENPYKYALIVFILVFLIIFVAFVKSFLRKKWEDLAFASLFLLLFGLPILFGNTTLPSRMYIGVLGIVLCAIFLRNLQGKTNTGVSLAIFLAITIYAINVGAVGNGNFALILIFALCAYILLLQRPSWKQLVVFLTFCLGLNWNSIVVQNVTSIQNVQLASRVIEELKKEGITPEKAKDYHLYIYHESSKPKQTLFTQLSMAWIGQPAIYFGSSETYTAQTFRMKGYEFKWGVHDLNKESVDTVKGAKSQVARIGNLTKEDPKYPVIGIDHRSYLKNIYFKLV